MEFFNGEQGRNWKGMAMFETQNGKMMNGIYVGYS